MSEKNWLTIWVRPRETIRRIVTENAKQGLWFLAAIYGFSALLNSFQALSFGSSLEAFPIFILALVFSPIWGYIVFSIWGYVVVFTGRWIKGQGDFQKTRAAYAWSCVPLAVGDLFWLILLMVFGSSLFVNPSPEMELSMGQSSLILALLFGKMVFSVWSLVIYLNALAEVQQFSIFRAIGNVIIAAILIGLVFGVFWYLILYTLGMSAQPASNAGAAFQILQEGRMFINDKAFQ